MSTDAQTILDELVNDVISQIRFDFTLTLLTDDGWWIVLEAGGEVDDEPFRPDDVARAAPNLVRLHRQTVTSARIADSGTLAMHFSNGSALTGALSDEYDSWHVVAPDKRRVHVDAGGRLVLFGE